MRLVYMVAALAVVLASIAAAYSMWSETLVVNANIDTGEVAVSFGEVACSDTGADPQLGDPFNNGEGKDVASCSYELAEDENGNMVEMTVTISNAYPGYEACIDFDVVNTGTIPVKLLSYEFEGVNETALTVSLEVPEDTQIHPEEASPYRLCIGVLQDADENSEYTFTLTLTFAQWNEVSG